jgi:hypothetical protein
MNTFTLTPLQRVSKDTATSLPRSPPNQPEAPLAIVISTAGGGALHPPPQAMMTMPSSPSHTSATAGCRLSGPASHGQGDRCVDAIV